MCHRLPLRTYQLPLFAFLVVIRCVVHYSRADVELATVVLPRLEDEMALLVVERKPGDVDRTVWYRLFIHRPPDARSIVIKSHVLRLRGSVPGCLLSSTNTKYIKIEWLLIFVSCNTFHGTILQHFITRRCVDIRLMQPSSLTNHQWSIKKPILLFLIFVSFPLNSLMVLEETWEGVTSGYHEYQFVPPLWLQSCLPFTGQFVYPERVRERYERCSCCCYQIFGNSLKFCRYATDGN